MNNQEQEIKKIKNLLTKITGISYGNKISNDELIDECLLAMEEFHISLEILEKTNHVNEKVKKIISDKYKILTEIIDYCYNYMNDSIEKH